MTIKIMGIFFLSLFSLTQGYDQPFLNHITNNYLNSFGIINEQLERPATQQKEDASLSDRIKTIFTIQRFAASVKSLTEREKRERAFTAAPVISYTHNTLIDTTFVDKMELVKGIEYPHLNVMANILTPYIYTKNGERCAVALLTQPTDNISLLQKRQTIIRQLIHDDSLRDSLQKSYQSMQDNELYLLSFFESEDPTHTEMFKKVYWNNWTPSSFNQSTFALECKTRLSHLSTFLALSALPLTLWLNASLGHYLASHAQLHQPISVMQALGRGLKTTATMVRNVPTAIKAGWNLTAAIPYAPIRYAARLTTGGLTGLYGFSLYKVFMDAKFQKDIANHLQMHMIGVASYVRNMQNVYDTAMNNATLQRAIPSLLATRNIPQQSEKLNTLLKLLDTQTFTGSPSFFSITGRVLAAHKIMQEIKYEFGHMLHVIGELETYLALATLYKKHENSPVHFAFAEFIESDKPYIHAQSFWNPLIDAKKAVSNTLELDGNILRSIILSGPNTGGKSTLLRALMLNVNFAQTFGIVAAEQWVMTPFSQLNAYLAVQDNLATNVSGWKAEVLRAKQLLQSIRMLPHNKFVFLIIDELFTATSPDQSERLAHEFIKNLCAENNCLFIHATHYAKLNTIEEDINTCKNYHMQAIVNAHGRVERYTYKIKEGSSTVKNAEQIAHEEHIL